MKRVSSIVARVARTLVRSWWWVAFVLGVLMLLSLPYIVFDVLASCALDRELAKIKASGAPITTADLAPPPVPKHENAAVIYGRAFELLPPREQGSPFLRALAFADPTKHPTETPASESEVADFVHQHHRVLDLLRQGAAMPKARYPVDWEAGAMVLFPHLSRLRDPTRLLMLDALLKSRRGDASGAMEDVDVMLRMADSVAPEPTLVSELVRYACQHIALETLNRLMTASPPSSEDCRNLHLVLSRIDLMEPFTHAMEGERALGHAVFEDTRRGEASYLRSWQALDGRTGVPRWPLGSAPLRFIWAPVLKKDEVIYLRYMERQVALSREPYDEKAWARLEQRLKRAPRYALVTRFVVPIFTRAARRRDEAVAYIGLAQWALALRVYQQKAGHYPDALNDVAAVVDWSLPNDRFTGRPFVYRREGEGYLLYSLGPNRQDDGAKERPSGKAAYAPGAPDDVVWRVTR